MSTTQINKMLAEKHREKFGCSIGYKICRFCEKKRKIEKFYGTRRVCRDCEKERQAQYGIKRRDIKLAKQEADKKKAKSSLTK